MIVMLRDASWFAYPSTDRRVVYHVPVCEQSPLAACSGRPLAEFTAVESDGLGTLLCRRRACRSRMPAPNQGETDAG